MAVRSAPPPLLDEQVRVLKSMWAEGSTRIQIAAAISSVSGGQAVSNAQVTALAKRYGLGAHPRDAIRTEKAAERERKRPARPVDEKPVDPLLATGGRYADLNDWARRQRPPLTMTQALQRYHRARAGG